MFSKC
jgi:cleavage and polyadenylation specificity factor subunit 2